MPTPPIPDNAFLQVTDLGGATVGGGPHTITSAIRFAAPVTGQTIDLGPYLTRKLRTQTVGSDAIAFSLVMQPVVSVVAGTWDWNSVDCSEWWWWTRAKANKSQLKFVYRRDADSAAGTANPEITVHITSAPNTPNIPGQPDTPEEYTVEILADYISINDGTTTLTWGTALA